MDYGDALEKHWLSIGDIGCVLGPVFVDPSIDPDFLAQTLALYNNITWLPLCSSHN